MTPTHSRNDAFSASEPLSLRKVVALTSVFLVVTILGLLYVKWWPYFQKAHHAAESHSIGSSILKGGADGSIWQSAWDYCVTYFNSIWKAALLGMIVAAMVQALIPVNWLMKVLGASTFRSTLIGGTAALPGMMCTCCAAPIASGMRKQRVSIGAALAFWMGNPALNPATLIFMTFVLSWKFTLLRVVFGLIATFGVSYLANRYAAREGETAVRSLPAEQRPEPAAPRPLWLQWALNFGSLFVRIVPTYLVSVYFIGLLQQLFNPDWGTGGFVAIVAFAVIGTLFVIPTAAEIPIVQTFLAIGAGPAGALLVTLPTISLPSLLLVSRSFPRKILVLVTASIMLLGVLSGLAAAMLL